MPSHGTLKHMKRLAGFIATAAATSIALGGGFLSDNGAGVPRKWTASPVVLNYDQGPLGSMTNGAANAMATTAINLWATANVPTCSLSFSVGTQLTQDHGNGVSTNPNYNEGAPDAITPVIYDQTGILTAGLFGGAEQVVIGFAGPRWISGGIVIIEGQAVLNGRFVDGLASPGDITPSQMQGVFTHEIGHMLNLDHSQCNDAYAMESLSTYTPNYTGYPTMYPLAHTDVGDLETDDKAWISELYPTAAYTANTTKITGVTRNSAAALVNGINVVCRNATNPLDVVTCVSGFLDPTPNTTADGAFRIPALAASTGYVLDFEQIDAGFTAGSSVGVIDPPLVVPGVAEFINESGIESNSDSISRSTTFVTGAGGSTLANADLQLNPIPSTSVIAEVDGGATFPNQATALTITPGTPLQINGAATSTEGGNITFIGGDPVEDWYVINPPAGIEITKVTLTPTTDCDLYICSHNQLGSTVNVPFSSLQAGTAVVETVESFMDSTNFGTGTGAKKIYIGVSNFTGEPAATYTLRIDSAIADSDAVTVTGTSTGTVDPTSGLIVVQGRGFKNVGGSPTVTFSKTGIQVNSVTFISANTLNVNVTRLGSYVASGTTDISVTNQAASGGYAGRRTNSVSAVPVAMSEFIAE